MSTDDQDSEWLSFRDRFEAGQLVEGLVIEHRPFGVFVDIGSLRFPGLIELPSLQDPPRDKNPGVPDVGTRVACVFLGFSGPDGRQPRLSCRPSLLRAALEVKEVENLPQHERTAFLERELQKLGPASGQAAVWRVKYLPAEDQMAFLQHALQHPNSSVAVWAVLQVNELPREQRSAFLQYAEQLQNPAVVAAVRRLQQHRLVE